MEKVFAERVRGLRGAPPRAGIDRGRRVAAGIDADIVIRARVGEAGFRDRRRTVGLALALVNASPPQPVATATAAMAATAETDPNRPPLIPNP